MIRAALKVSCVFLPQAMHRAAEEKTEISYNLAEKEELIFYLTQKIPRVRKSF